MFLNFVVRCIFRDHGVDCVPFQLWLISEFRFEVWFVLATNRLRKSVRVVCSGRSGFCSNLLVALGLDVGLN